MDPKMDPNTPGAPGAPPAPPDGGAGTAPPAAPAPGAAPFVVSKDEWLDSRREVRAVKEMLAKLTPATAPPAAPPSDDGKGKGAPPAPTVDADVRARLDLADAIDESGLALTKENKALVKRLFAAERPQNAREWLAETAKILPSAPVAAAPTAATPPTAPSNTGAPVPSPAAGQLPDDPRQWPADVVRKMSSEDFRKELTKYQATQSGINPFRHLRKR
jgi:hypothetical protein